MSEMESGVTRGDARRTTVKTVARLVRIAAVVVGLGGLAGAAYRPHGASLAVAFFAFVVYLICDHLCRR